MFYLPHKTATAGAIVVVELFVPLTLNQSPALCVTALGIHGIYAEFCRPGTVIPGVSGSALVLVGIASISRFPMSPTGLALVLLSVVLLAAALLIAGSSTAAGNFKPAMATCAMTLLAAIAMAVGLRNLLAAPEQIGWVTACCIALPLTCSTAFLLLVAAAARRAKALDQPLSGTTIF